MELQKQEPKFEGANPDLPTLNYGASAKENRPMEFLREFGEYCAVHLKGCIAPAFLTTPPANGQEEDEPLIPDQIPNNNVGKAMLSEYNSDKKEWKLEKKKVIEQIGSTFSMVYGNLSESSRSQIEDDEQWEAKLIERDLLYLISRIRATQIAHQSGNLAQDKERVRNVWATMRQQTSETSFAFRKRIEDYQLQRLSVGLEAIVACGVGTHWPVLPSPPTKVSQWPLG
jgi:hypothetical protein